VFDKVTLSEKNRGRSKFNGEDGSILPGDQHTLPFGTLDEVRREVCQRIRIFGPGGGFVFNAIHNIQAQTPIENVLAMFETAQECGRYPL